MPALLAVQRRARELRALRSRAEAVGRLGQDRAQDVGDDVELVVTRDERRRELHHGSPGRRREDIRPAS